jgi:hypothetical protein
VEFDGGLVTAESSPRKEREARGQWWWSPAHRRRLGVQSGTVPWRRAWLLAG